MRFESEPFDINLGEQHVFKVAARKPPAGWQARPPLSLDDALPYPWPEKYLTTFHQPFNPHGFMVNSAALANEFRRTRHADVRRIATDLHARFREYSVMRDGGRYVVYQFAKSYRRIIVEPPWTSAYASGAALIGLTLLADSEAVPAAHDDAREILAGMGRVVATDRKEGLWVSFRDEHGCLWFEEMPLPQAEQPRILNGHIRALTGLYIYWVRRRDPEALELLRGGTLTVKRHAMDYRRPGDVNAYDLLAPPIADYGPDRTIDQQDFLWRMTGDAAFAGYRDTFRSDIVESRRRAELTP